MAHNLEASPSCVAASAPGKVLLAGGYLVLDRDYTGLVFGLDARIHVHVQLLNDLKKHEQESRMIVQSPQFLGAEWRYSCHAANDDGGVKVIQTSG